MGSQKGKFRDFAVAFWKVKDKITYTNISW